jgi:hypothetical protein
MQIFQMLTYNTKSTLHIKILPAVSGNSKLQGGTYNFPNIQIFTSNLKFYHEQYCHSFWSDSLTWLIIMNGSASGASGSCLYASYLGGCHQKDHGSRQVCAKSSWDPISIRRKGGVWCHPSKGRKLKIEWSQSRPAWSKSETPSPK